MKWSCVNSSETSVRKGDFNHARYLLDISPEIDMKKDIKINTKKAVKNCRLLAMGYYSQIGEYPKIGYVRYKNF